MLTVYVLGKYLGVVLYEPFGKSVVLQLRILIRTWAEDYHKSESVGKSEKIGQITLVTVVKNDLTLSAFVDYPRNVGGDTVAACGEKELHAPFPIGFWHSEIVKLAAYKIFSLTVYDETFSVVRKVHKRSPLAYR